MSFCSPCKPRTMVYNDQRFQHHEVIPEWCRNHPMPMQVLGWSLADLLNGELLRDRNQATGTVEHLRDWRAYPVRGYSLHPGPQCHSIWVTDAAEVLHRSSHWHSVLALADALNILGPGHQCGPVPRDGEEKDNFPPGAIALLEWEAGRRIEVDGRGHVAVQMGLSRERIDQFLEKGGKAMGWTLGLCIDHLLAYAPEGGAV